MNSDTASRSNLDGQIGIDEENDKQNVDQFGNNLYEMKMDENLHHLIMDTSINEINNCVCCDEAENSKITVDAKHIRNVELEIDAGSLHHPVLNPIQEEEQLQNNRENTAITPSLVAPALELSSSESDERVNETSTIEAVAPALELSSSESDERVHERATIEAVSGLTEVNATSTPPTQHNPIVEETTATAADDAAATTTETTTAAGSLRPNRYFILFLIRVTTKILETVWIFSPLIFFMCLFLTLPTWTLFGYLMLVLLSAHLRYYCAHRLSTIDHAYSKSRIVSNLIRRECAEVTIKPNRQNATTNQQQLLQSDEFIPDDKFKKDSFEIVTSAKKLVFSQKLLPRQTKAPRRHRFFNWKSKKFSSTKNLLRTSTASRTKPITDLEMGVVAESSNIKESVGVDCTNIEKDNIDNNEIEEEIDDEDDVFVDEDKYDVGEGCDICMACFEVGDVVTWSKNPNCGHMFHDKCIVEWLCGVQRKLTCPCCRNDYYYEVVTDNQKRKTFGCLRRSRNNINDPQNSNDNNDTQNGNNNHDTQSSNDNNNTDNSNLTITNDTIEAESNNNNNNPTVSNANDTVETASP